jgi:N-acetylmuramoyl-L-alanine amidase
MHCCSMRFAASLVAIGLATACGHAAPATAPTPATDTAAAPATPPPLPDIPRVEGPLAIKVVYPSPNQQLTSRDSNFIFGSVGDGRATLTINGAPARVYANGAFMAFVPVPPLQSPAAPYTATYELSARVGKDSARASLPVRVPAPRVSFATSGPLVVDTASASPRSAGLRMRNDELVRVSVRAPANATSWIALPYETRPLVVAPEGTRGDSNTFAGDVLARDLYEPANLVVARGPDTVRVPLARIEPADTGTTRLVRIGTLPPAGAADTDRVINGRPVAGGTYKWFFFPGTIAEETGRTNGFVRVRLDSQLEVWVNASDVQPLPPGAVLPRRTTGNARVRSAAEWVDFIIPIGERPAYSIEESDRALSLVLYGTRSNTDIIQYVGNDTLIRTAEWAQATSDRARFTVHLTQPLYGYLVLYDSGNVVLRLRRKPRIDPGRPLRGMTISVDPGHPPIGATGPTGLYEGDAVLAVGMRLKELLEARGATVAMTRTTPDPVDLGLRPVLARRANANAFVSIHLNAYPDGVNIFTADNGTGTYFFHALSEPLARPVQRGLVARMGLSNLGVYYDNLAVVRQTWMPSVLTEGAFVIVPEQEAALRQPVFQERYARGIADGLEEYFRWLARQ